jgi:hypothetical protein
MTKNKRSPQTAVSAEIIPKKSRKTKPSGGGFSAPEALSPEKAREKPEGASSLQLHPRVSFLYCSLRKTVGYFP